MGMGGRRHGAVEAQGSSSAKKMKADPAAAAAAAKKVVMRRLPPEQVELFLAKTFRPPVRSPPGPEIPEEYRRESARIRELIRDGYAYIRSIQDDYRRQLRTKGFVEVEVSDDDEGF